MPDGVRWTRPGGGPTLWLELPRSIDLAGARGPPRAARRASSRTPRPRSSATAHLHGFRIAYAYLSEDEMRAALTILADALRTWRDA